MSALRNRLALLVALSLAACSTSVSAPPVEIQYRPSLVGIGKILRITNRHSEALTGVEVRIENPNGDVRNHAFASLAAGATEELGWKKLDGFEIEAGAEVTLRAEGFVLPTKVVLPEEES